MQRIGKGTDTMRLDSVECLMEGMTEDQKHTFRMCSKDALATMDQTLPFHNVNHATNVLRGVMDITSEMLFLSQNEIAMLALVALMHDAGHSGITNNQHAMWKTSIYHRYGDQSTNEKMHADIAITLLRKHNAFKLFSSDINEAMVYNLILCTDIVQHPKHMNEIKKSCSREHLYMLIIKLADISHSIGSFENCLMWSKQINEEFGHILNTENEAKFLENTALEICMRLLEMVPSDKLRGYVVQIEANIDRFRTDTSV